MSWNYNKLGSKDPINSLVNGIRTPNEGWNALGMAIVVQAAKDLRGKKEDRYTARKFFEDEGGLINMILPNGVSGKALLKQIEKNYKQYGSWKAKDIEEYEEE